MPSRNPPVSYPDTPLVTQGEIFIAIVICYSNIQNIRVTQVTRDGDLDLLRAVGNKSGQDSEPQEASPSDPRVNSWTALTSATLCHVFLLFLGVFFVVSSKHCLCFSLLEMGMNFAHMNLFMNKSQFWVMTFRSWPISSHGIPHKHL